MKLRSFPISQCPLMFKDSGFLGRHLLLAWWTFLTRDEPSGNAKWFDDFLEYI
jgi:hypothetical protein